MANQDEESSSRGFKVHDRRRFSSSGEAREPEEGAEAAPPPRESEAAAATRPPGEPAQAAAARDAYAQAAHEPDKGADYGEAQMNFSTFVLSLSTQALAYLGEIPDPATNTTHVDLAAARHFIDILAMLQQKTSGNLDPSESEILQHALYDLRMRFVDHSQRR